MKHFVIVLNIRESEENGKLALSYSRGCLPFVLTLKSASYLLVCFLYRGISGAVNITNVIIFSNAIITSSCHSYFVTNYIIATFANHTVSCHHHNYHYNYCLHNHIIQGCCYEKNIYNKTRLEKKQER